MTLRSLNDREKDVISEKLKMYGFILNGGSVESGVYHLSLNTHGAATIGNNLGAELKKILNAKTIFVSGIQISVS